MARDWIEMLIDLAREQKHVSPKDPRFDELIEGRLREAEKEQLARDATASSESMVALAVCSPLQDDVKERLLRRVKAELSAPPTGERDPLDVPDGLDDGAMASGEASKSEGRVRSQPLRGFPVAMALAVAFLAAGLTGYLAWPSDTAMSAYDLEVAVENQHGAVAPAHSEATVLPGEALVLELRARGEGKRAASASVFLDDPSSGDRRRDLRKLGAKVVVSGDVIHITVPNSTLISTSKDGVEIVVAAVAQGTAPTTAAQLEELADTGHVRTFRQRIHVAR